MNDVVNELGGCDFSTKFIVLKATGDSELGAAITFVDITGISTAYGYVKDLVASAVTTVTGLFSPETVNPVVVGDGWPTAVKPIM